MYIWCESMWFSRLFDLVSFLGAPGSSRRLTLLILATETGPSFLRGNSGLVAADTALYPSGPLVASYRHGYEIPAVVSTTGQTVSGPTLDNDVWVTRQHTSATTGKQRREGGRLDGESTRDRQGEKNRFGWSAGDLDVP